VQEAQFDFLENYLLAWLVPCAIAIREQGDAFYGRLAELTLALTADHHAAGQHIKRHRLPVVNNQSQAVLSLEDGRTGLREIAEYLVTPVLAGLYIGRGDINRLARGMKLPHGFGSRALMLQTLFESAGQYESAPELFAALDDLLAGWGQAYEQIGQAYPNIPHFVLPWQIRLRQTQEVFRLSAGKTRFSS
jgi:hypothetical protein